MIFCVHHGLLLKAAPFYVQGAFQYDSVTEAEGMLVHMLPSCLTFTPPAIYGSIPDDTEILITHTPPYGTLDKTRRGKYAGCQTLSSRLNHLKNCRLHVFGHIHEAAGARVDKVGSTELPRVSVNAAMERNESAIVVDLRN